MVFAYIVPPWFFRIDSLFEIIFSISTLIIAITSFKIYSLSKEKNILKFGVGFLLLAISYAIWAAMNAITIQQLQEKMTNIEISQLLTISTLGANIYMMLFMAGLVTLAYATFNINKGGIYYLLLGPTLTVIAISLEKIITFRIISIFFLSFIAYHYIDAYSLKQNNKTLGALISFSLLFIANFIYLFAPLNSLSYVISHGIELLAYIGLMAVLFRTLQHNTP